jgi:hypothetical protein
VTRASGRVVVLLQDLAKQLPGIQAAGLRPVLWQPVSVSGAWTVLALLVQGDRVPLELDRLVARGFSPPPEALFDQPAAAPKR